MNDAPTKTLVNLAVELEAHKAAIADTIAYLGGLYAEQGRLVRQIHQLTQAMDTQNATGWRPPTMARNIEICRVFLTTDIKLSELAHRFGLSTTMIGIIFFKYGIPSDRSFSGTRSRQRRERQRFGHRRDDLPPDLQAMIEGMKAATQ